MQRMAVSHFTPRARSVRVERFRYGEALTEDQCLERLRTEADAHQGPIVRRARG